MNYYALGPTIVAFFVLIQGLFVLLKNRNNRLNLIYFYLSISLFIWLICFSIMYWASGNYDFAYFFARIGFIGVILTPVCVFHFTAEFLNSSLKKYAIYFYLLTIPVILINFFSHLMYSGLSTNFWGYYPIAGKLYFIALFQFIGTFSVATIILFTHFREKNINIIRKEQIKYLMMAFAIALFASGDYIIKYPFINFYPFGYIVVIFFSFIMALNAIKNNLMDIRVVITKGTILILLYIFVLGIPIYLGFSTKKWFISFILLFVLSTLAPLVLRYLQRKAEKILLAEQEKYQQFLLQASKGMVEQKEISKLTQLIVRMITKSVRVKFAALFIYDEEKQVYYCIASRGQHLKNKNITFDNKSYVIKFMKSNTSPFFFLAAPERIKNIFSEISDNSTLIIPAVIRKDLTAFMILGEKINETLYSNRDLEVFRTLSNQAALAIANCNFLNKTNSQQKRLFEAEKLASIGGMADGLAHQIKNRLNNFSLIGGELDFEIKEFKDKYQDFIEQKEDVKKMISYIEEMSDSITKNVKKTDSILKGILNFAKTNEQDKFFAIFSFKEIVEQSIELIKIKHHKTNISFSYEIPKEDNIYGIKVQIQEAVFNCIDNAYEAIIEKIDCIKNPLLHDIKIPNIDVEDYKPNIIIRLEYVDKKAKISIEDNGIGIKDDNKSKIFSAFFTTKVSSKSGSGIGSYVVKRMIVENHKGNIEFKSKYGYGTTFTITLPMGKNI